MNSSDCILDFFHENISFCLKFSSGLKSSKCIVNGVWNNLGNFHCVYALWVQFWAHFFLAHLLYFQARKRHYWDQIVPTQNCPKRIFFATHKDVSFGRGWQTCSKNSNKKSLYSIPLPYSELLNKLHLNDGNLFAFYSILL